MRIDASWTFDFVPIHIQSSTADPTFGSSHKTYRNVTAAAEKYKSSTWTNLKRGQYATTNFFKYRGLI